MRTLTLILSLVAFCLAAPVHAQQTSYPNDAYATAYAIAAKMTHQQVPETIIFSPETAEDMVGVADQTYAGFNELFPMLMAYRNDRGGATYNADLTGFLHIKNPDGRMATLRFVVRYTVNGQNIHVYQCVVAVAPPARPSLETFLVPADRLRQFPSQDRSDWTKFHTFARHNAYNPQRDKARDTTYVVISFLMNRLPATAQFRVIVGERKTTRRTQDNLAQGKEVYMGYNGWPVHMVQAKFNPTSQRNRFYINYYYTPIPDQAPIKLASYDSKPVATGPTAPMQQLEPAPKKSTPVAQPAPSPAPITIPAPTSAPATTPTVQGPLERGMAFLNPIFPDDVEIIQKRLTALGHYNGPINGSLNPMTQKGLDSFAEKHTLPKGQWSLGLQKALFRGAGL